MTTTYRSFKTFNEDAFIKDLAADLRNFSVDLQSDINDDLTVWYTIFLKNLDHHAPYKTKRVKSKKLPDWYNDEISNVRRKRDACKRNHLWSEYRKYRNMTKSLIRKAKRKHFSDSVTQSKDTRAMWQHFRKINNKDKSSSSNLPEEIIVDNERHTSSEDVASKLNEYFSTISDKFGSDNPDNVGPDLSKLTTFVNDKIPDDIYFKIPYITQEQVAISLMNLDSNKAIGLDGIGPRIIKSAANVLSDSISSLINKSIATGKFPDRLKLAKVYPIHKSGSKSDPCNYRPISILPTLSKIFEKHVNKHLMAYMNKYNIIHESQSGFRQKHSCQTALIKLIDQWMADIDKGDTIGSMFIDFRKAFDLVDHIILKQKLAAYELNDTSLRWFTSYLESRKQSIQYDRGMTSFTNIKSGVPQGSILGPTLFLLFVNDLPLFLKHCYCDLFADDTTVHTSSSDTNKINEEISADFVEIINWSKRNKLPINLDKTTYMLLKAKHRLDAMEHLELHVEGTSIKQVSKQKLLGIIIDENLSWTPQIDNLCSILSSKISLLKHISAYVPQDVQKIFYQAYILPLIDYGSNTWGTTSGPNIERLSKLQKRAARIILKADFMTPALDMFDQLSWQSIPKRLMYNKAILAIKALNNLTPTYITNLLKPISQTHSRCLRSSENGLLSIPRSRSVLFDRSFSYSASKLWNLLPLNLRTAGSLNEFKSYLRNYI